MLLIASSQKSVWKGRTKRTREERIKLISGILFSIILESIETHLIPKIIFQMYRKNNTKPRRLLRTWRAATTKAANIKHKCPWLLSSSIFPCSHELMVSNPWNCRAFLFLQICYCEPWKI